MWRRYDIQIAREPSKTRPNISIYIAGHDLRMEVCSQETETRAVRLHDKDFILFASLPILGKSSITS